MTQPAVNITEIDGALGILPETAGRLLAVVGVSSAGTADVPATFARVSDLVAAFGYGPMVEAAAYHIVNTGRPVVVVKTGNSNPGTFPAGTTTVFTGTGTSVITVDDTNTDPYDDLQFYFKVVTGGTIGTAGITFQWSLDNGRTLSPVTDLGTATTFVFPESGGAEIEFAAGTLVAGDTATFRGDAPLWNSTEVGTALDALFNSAVNWEIAEIVGNIDATSFDVIDPKFSAGLTTGKYHSWYGHIRMPNLAETSAAYLTAASALLSAKSTVFGGITAAAAKTSSGVSGRSYRRPPSFAVASREQFNTEEINIADVNLGTLPGISILDANGNPEEHDESVNPGLDDARFTVLRTWPGIQGVYVNRSRIFSAAGSDFNIFPKRRVLNLGHVALRNYFTRRLNQPIEVDPATGFILESEAQEMETGGKVSMESLLLAKPKASGVEVTISRTDNILSTGTITGTARVTPLAYAETINLEFGFTNPALATQTV